MSVTNKSTGKLILSQQCDEVNDSNQVQISSMLDYYQHEGRPWLTPATYTVHVWCQEGQYSLNKTAGRPQKVDICIFSFSVYERGFK